MCREIADISASQRSTEFRLLLRLVRRGQIAAIVRDGIVESSETTTDLDNVCGGGRLQQLSFAS